MSSFSIQEAQDLSAFATQTLERLTAAATRFEEAHAEPSEERTWLESATRRVSEGQDVDQPRADFADAVELRLVCALVLAHDVQRSSDAEQVADGFAG